MIKKKEVTMFIYKGTTAENHRSFIADALSVFPEIRFIRKSTIGGKIAEFANSSNDETKAKASAFIMSHPCFFEDAL
jgi:hypothetical protein